ncbi:hypothetical protein M758_11G041900 [Ceratodon purpureus]|uniref:Uncharacterized protein n=1 Tax=Ceratodon purpureus TaxID=3225 RepID=A0A8T0GC67_CERPU|nr:hypothetical protein KC19_11G043400 [Ceratodon purpureus]KAG0600535.1 hypothetical protein M758_11G041900 [Ceratodon purpureus]
MYTLSSMSLLRLPFKRSVISSHKTLLALNASGTRRAAACSGDECGAINLQLFQHSKQSECGRLRLRDWNASRFIAEDSRTDSQLIICWCRQRSNYSTPGTFLQHATSVLLKNLTHSVTRHAAATVIAFHVQVEKCSLCLSIRLAIGGFIRNTATGQNLTNLPHRVQLTHQIAGDIFFTPNVTG